ncbi:hypothetical protein LX36DRAFT_258966 [Colletotrichum falcatum]|nr:hypothetical protein LX36DRAFT_258966 [Colletotrichum falcatum]
MPRDDATKAVPFRPFRPFRVAQVSTRCSLIFNFGFIFIYSLHLGPPQVFPFLRAQPAPTWRVCGHGYDGTYRLASGKLSDPERPNKPLHTLPLSAAIRSSL